MAVTAQTPACPLRLCPVTTRISELLTEWKFWVLGSLSLTWARILEYAQEAGMGSQPHQASVTPPVKQSVEEINLISLAYGSPQARG